MTTTAPEDLARAILGCTLPKAEWETLTAYYCGAVAHLVVAGRALEDVLAHALAARAAPLDFWRRDELMATRARLAWLARDHTLPFDTAFVSG